MTTVLSISRRLIIRTWLILSGLLVLLSILLSFANPLAQASHLAPRTKEIINALYAIFYLDAEMSVPNWFSSMGLMACAVLLIFNGLQAHLQIGKFGWRWAGLGLIFILLSIDESIGFHERSMVLGRQILAWLAPGLALRHAWVVFAPLILLIAGALYWPVLSRLPRSVQFRIAVSAVLYLTGTLVIETLGGELLNTMSQSSPGYVVLIHIEESLELAGVILFANALLLHLNSQLAGRPLEVTFN